MYTFNKPMERIIERTDDGSATLFVPELNEHYHSVKGARTESLHIFVEMGLQASTAPHPRILEIGFGTGFNALLTLEEAEKSHQNIHYTGIELYPLSWETVQELKYSDSILFEILHTAPWETDIPITPHFNLRKIQADANELLMRSDIDIDGYSMWDVIYFDAFAPEKQPELWTQKLFDRLYVLLNKHGILTTYCAKGVVRRMLQAAGFTVERLPGPPGGKREILRARKNN